MIACSRNLVSIEPTHPLQQDKAPPGGQVQEAEPSGAEEGGGGAGGVRGDRERGRQVRVRRAVQGTLHK